MHAGNLSDDIVSSNFGPYFFWQKLSEINWSKTDAIELISQSNNTLKLFLPLTASSRRHSSLNILLECAETKRQSESEYKLYSQTCTKFCVRHKIFSQNEQQTQVQQTTESFILYEKSTNNQMRSRAWTRNISMLERDGECFAFVASPKWNRIGFHRIEHFIHS